MLDLSEKLTQEAQISIEESDWKFTFESILSLITCLTPDPKINRFMKGSETLMLLAILRTARKKVKHLEILTPENINFPKRLSKDARSAINALSNVWYQKMLLCEQLHTGRSTPYRDAAHWFFELANEVRLSKIEARSSGRDILRGKKKLAEIIQNDLNQLRNNTNPEDRQTAPHYWLLLEKGLKEVQGSDGFERTYWRPFLSSIVAWKNELKTNPALVSAFTEGGDLFVQHGQGRAKLLSPNLKPEKKAGEGFQRLSSKRSQAEENVQT